MKSTEFSILVALFLLANISFAFNGDINYRISNLQSGVYAFLQKKPTTTFSFSKLYTSSTDDEAQEEETKDDEGGATDILNSPAFLKRKLELLKEDTLKIETDITEIKTKVEEGKAEWGERLDQLDKEFLNIQERLIKQTSESGGQATIDVVRKILDVIDNYDRAFKSVQAPSNDVEAGIEADYKKSYDMILATFKTLGVEQLDTIGQEFDYEKHQAVFTRPSDEYDEGVICEELATGWTLGDVLIRPAMVCVAQ